MRHILYIVVFISQGVFAQWNIISPAVGTDHVYTDVFFVNKDTGFVTGKVHSACAILRTLNGGLSWDTTYTYPLNGVYNELLYSIHFPTKSVGYAIGGGNIYKTNDCGDSWMVVDTGDVHSGIGGGTGPQIIFINKDTGFAAYQDGGGGFLRTYDGGLTWFQDLVMPGARNFNYCNGNYYACHGGWAFLDEATLTWHSFDNNITPYFHYVNALMLNGRAIVIGDKMGGSSYGVYAYSDDMGINWNISYVNPGRLTNITFLNDTLGHLGGNFIGTMRTHDAGATWSYTPVNNLETGMSRWFKNFCFVNDTIGYGVSLNGIYKTTNGGGPAFSQAVFFDPNASITESTEINPFIYPNPFKDNINITNLGIGNTEVYIYSLDGKEVLRIIESHQNQIDVSFLPNGMYVVKLVSGDEIFTIRIVKE